MKQQIPPLLEMELNKVASQYSRSPATTNAGVVLRFLARFVTVDTVVKLFAHKLKKPS